MTAFQKRPQQVFNTPPPGHKWWKTRKGAMLKLLWDLSWHTQAECLTASKHRFGGVIGSLRTDGWKIETIKTSTTVASFEYRLLSCRKGQPLGTRKRLYLSQAATEALADGIITNEAIAVASEVLGD